VKERKQEIERVDLARSEGKKAGDTEKEDRARSEGKKGGDRK
jgi:hypothetical protein